MFRILIVLISLFLPLSVFATSSLNFALLTINGEQRQAYLEQVRAFEKKHPDIKVNIQAVESEDYKANIEGWLQAEKFSDVMFWFGGERLNWYVEKGWVLPLDELWDANNWYHKITQSAQSAVTKNGRIYGLPIHYYHWGIYYNKEMFKRLDIPLPTNWQEFLQTCETLKANAITPIALGSKEAWPLAGWFDYFNLRLNGLDFHQGLMEGRESYSDPRVIRAFSHWKELIERDYFLDDHQALTWRQTLPYLYRDMAGMFLMGNFWTSQIPDRLRDKFGVFSFPVINPDVAIYEEAPTDVLIVPSNVQNKENALKFLEFMSQLEVQQALNERLGMLAPQNIPPQRMDHFVSQGAVILRNAEGASQFYDRDNPQPIAIEGMELMQRFVNNPGALPVILQEYKALIEKSFQ